MQHLVTFALSDTAEAASSPILPHTSELIFGLVVFAILFTVIAKKVVPNLEQTYAARAAAIEGRMNEAEAAQARADAALKSYEEQLHEARAEAAKIRDDAREQGAKIHAELREQAQAEAARIVDSAHKQTDAERQAAVVSLRGEIGRLSSDLASKIVGESLHDEARQKGIIDRFIAELEAGDVAPAAAPSGSDS